MCILEEDKLPKRTIKKRERVRGLVDMSHKVARGTRLLGLP